MADKNNNLNFKLLAIQSYLFTASAFLRIVSLKKAKRHLFRIWDVETPLSEIRAVCKKAKSLSAQNAPKL